MEKIFQNFSVPKKESHTCLEHQGEFWLNYFFNKQESAKAAGVKQFDEMMCSLIQLHYFYQTLIQPSEGVGVGKCWLQTWSYAVISVWKMGLMSHFNCAHYQPERICSPTLAFSKKHHKKERDCINLGIEKKWKRNKRVGARNKREAKWKRWNPAKGWFLS